MNENDGYETILTALDDAFPSVPPIKVADEDWGDYHDAKVAFDRIHAHWDADAVFQNRSVIGFVNWPAFLYLIPRFFRASIASGDIVWDVLEYTIRPLRDRLISEGRELNSNQNEALTKMLKWWSKRLLECECDTGRLVNDIAQIQQQLTNDRC
jgi:hypothetical protein